MTDTKQHNWISSTLGHGETMCSNCFMTNREAAVLGKLNECSAPASTPEPTNEEITPHIEPDFVALPAKMRFEND